MKYLLTTFFGLSIISAFAQLTASELQLEEVPISADAQSVINAQLGAPGRCYRLYVTAPENYELQVMFGDLLTPLELNATGGFYQSVFGGPSSLDIDPDNFGVSPALAYDSWITIGYETNAPNETELYPTPVPFDAWEAGGNLDISDLFGAGIFIASNGENPNVQADENGRILIAQLTFAGTVNGTVNVQLRRLNEDGTIYDPPGDSAVEIELFTGLTFNSGPSDQNCLVDIDNSGFVDTSDLLICIAGFGTAGLGLPGDVNTSGNVNTADILLVVGAFGTSCLD